jgi:hypothetical protein
LRTPTTLIAFYPVPNGRVLYRRRVQSGKALLADTLEQDVEALLRKQDAALRS